LDVHHRIRLGMRHDGPTGKFRRQKKDNARLGEESTVLHLVCCTS
jgi:hypothetical protein